MEPLDSKVGEVVVVGGHGPAPSASLDAFEVGERRMMPSAGGAIAVEVCSSCAVCSEGWDSPSRGGIVVQSECRPPVCGAASAAWESGSLPFWRRLFTRR